MIILAFDCAGAGCSVALWRDGDVIAHHTRLLAHGQGDALLPMIQGVLAEAGLGFPDLAAIATTLGPGSFTGLRAGLAAARGLALATGLKAIGVTTLEAAAHAVAPRERRGRAVVAAIDTRRDDLFIEAFDESLASILPAQVLSVDAAAGRLPDRPLVLTGDATNPLAAALAAHGRDVVTARAAGAIDARVVAGLAAARLAQGQPAAALDPVYLRAPEVTPAPAPVHAKLVHGRS